MHLSRETRNAYCAMASCVLAGGLLYFITITALPSIPVAPVTFACYAGFILIWLRLMNSRFLHPTALGCLRGAATLMVAWLFVRTVKYAFVLSPPVTQRYVWYSYYLFYSFIPTFLALAVLHVGKRNDEHIARAWWLLLIVALTLSVLFLTNDFHGLAFRFETSSLRDIDDTSPYSYGPLYFLSWAWTIALAVGAVALSTLRTFRFRPRWDWLMLLVPIALGLTYSTLYALSPSFHTYWPYKMPETICILIVLFMECLIRLGLFPANEGYLELWHASSLSGGLMRDDGSIAFSSTDAPQVTEGRVRAALTQPVPLGGDVVLSAQAIQGGAVFWLRDLSHVHALQEELEGLGDVFAEENAMLEAETELEHEREANAQRNHLHEQVMAGIAPQLDRIEALLASAGKAQNEQAFIDLMHRAAVHGSYAKRYANLTLSGESGSVDTRELYLAMSETAAWLKSCGIEPELAHEATGFLPTNEALTLYQRFFEQWDGSDVP